MLPHGYVVQAHYPGSYSNQPGLPAFRLLQLPYSSGVYPTKSEQLLKYQLGVLEALREFGGPISYLELGPHYKLLQRRYQAGINHLLHMSE